MPTIDSRIVEVTVYTDRAHVTRRGAAKLSVGEQTLLIPNLPTTLREDSVRATGKGANVKILGVDVVKTFVTRAPEANIAELERQLETLQDEDRAFADEDAAAVTQIEFLKTLNDSTGRSLAKGLAYGNTSLDRVQQFADYAARELATCQARRRDLAQKRREQKRKIEAVQAQLDQTRHVETNERYEIQVVVEAAAETNFELEVTYVVLNARWSPLYDIRLQDTAVALSYLAEVTQSSGEDWSSVEMLLSTARPAETTEIPELDPWYIDAFRPAPPRTFAPQTAGVARGAGVPAPAPMLAVMEDAMPMAQMAEASIEASGATVTYRIARTMNIPSDNAPHKTAITTLDLAAQLDYITAPKIAEEAYVRAKIKNTSAFVLLAGSMNVFHGADFVGATQIEMTAPNEEIQVQLGVDDRIKVERKLIERTVDKTLIGNTRRMLFGYKITLTNLLTTNAKITLLDQLPAARHEEIKVKLRDAAPKATEQTNLNVLKWEVEFKPQEKREITFGFTVEHPRDMRLTGLNN